MDKEDLLRIGAAYIRVSDERQDEYSPDSQLKKIREYAAKDGYIIPDEYVFYDDGISGKSVKKRDDFNRMIALAKEKTHPFDVIYVWKFSRFARNQEESMVYKNLLRKRGVTVVSVSEPIPEGHFGSLIERIIEWTDEYYLVNLGVEVTRGMTEKATRGEPTCPPPFGYIMRDKMYYPDEESGKANIVREIFTLYANGVKQREIAMMMGERGIRTRYGKKPENRWIDYVLHNPCYIGKIRWSLDGARAVSKYDFENEKIMTVDGHHEPLISMELWDKVQKMLEEQRKVYPKYARKSQPIDHLLKGLVRCSSCGGTLAVNGKSGKAGTRCLQCCNYSRGSCHTSHGITIPRIEAAFIEGLKQAVGAKQFTLVPTKPKNTDHSLIDFDKLITVEERRLARAKEAYLAEIDTIEQYKQNKEEITKRIDDLIARRDKEIVKETDIDAFAEKVSGIVDFIQREDVTAVAKNEALHTIIEKIIYEKAKGNLAIYFHDL
ncbi:MAG: recombinase family protein [Clostridia bacterium]|nr:recombinase family protein [Clostridia bacterium]